MFLSIVRPLIFVALLFAAPASAFDNSNATQPRIGQTALTCHPPLDRSDPDPVVTSGVSIGLNDKYEPTFMNVTHWLFSGREVDRGTQYSNDGVWKTAGLNEWFWSGRLMRNPRVSMTGRLYLSVRGWFYEERLFRNGRLDQVISEACGEGDA
jgi:hypothetical protein